MVSFKNRIIVLFSSILVAWLAVVAWLFVAFSSYVEQGLVGLFPDVIYLILAWIGVIFVTSVSSLVMFWMWFRQDEARFSDVPFLFAVFYFAITLAKLFNAFVFIVLLYIDAELSLILNKIYFILILLELIPLMFLGFGVILFSLSLSKRVPKLQRLQNKALQDRIRLILIVSLLIVELGFIIIAPTLEFISTLLPFITVPSLLMIIYIFYLGRKHKVLDKVNPGILIIGFFLMLFVQILRPVLFRIFGETVTTAVIGEFAIMIVFFIVMIGLFKNPKETVVSFFKKRNKKIKEMSFVLVIVAPMIYIVVTAIAMAFYGGGTILNPHTEGYIFLENFFSDLGRTVSLSGESNIVSYTLFTIAAVILTASISMYLASSVHFFKSGRKYDTATILLLLAGAIMVFFLIAVVFTAWDVFTDTHRTFSTLFSLSGLLVMGILAGLILKNHKYPNIFAAVWISVIGISIAFTIAFTFLFDSLTPESLLFLAGFQKITQYSWLVALSFQGYGSLKLFKSKL